MGGTVPCRRSFNDGGARSRVNSANPAASAEIVEAGGVAAYSGRMSRQSETDTGTAATTAPSDCPRCHKPMPLCVCDDIAPIDNRVSVLILQHPQEQDRALGKI